MTRNHHQPQPQSPAEFYGEELRRRREAAGMTQDDLGRAVICSGSFIAHIEAGRRTPKPDIAQSFDRVFDTGQLFYNLLGTLYNSGFAPHFAAYAELEKQATTIEEYSPCLIPGLLQTRQYAQAVFRAWSLAPVADDVERKVNNRLARAEVFNDPEAPVYWAIISEAALRTRVGGPEVMAAQIRHLIRHIDSGRVLVQVLPLAAGAHPLMESNLSLLRFSDAPDLAYVEGVHIGSLLDDPASVRRCREQFDLVRALALPPADTLQLLHDLAKDYENAPHP